MVRIIIKVNCEYNDKYIWLIYSYLFNGFRMIGWVVVVGVVVVVVVEVVVVVVVVVVGFVGFIKIILKEFIFDINCMINILFY